MKQKRRKPGQLWRVVTASGYETSDLYVILGRSKFFSSVFWRIDYCGSVREWSEESMSCDKLEAEASQRGAE